MSAAVQAGPSGCKLVKLGEIAVTKPGTALIEASLNGHPAQFILDTGAATSLIWKSTVDALNLPATKSSLGTICGAGGCRESGVVRVQDFGLGEFHAHDVRFVTTASNRSHATPDGVLGEDFLSKMDVEFDLGAGRVRLFQPVGCQGDQVVYWATGYFMVTLLPSAQSWLETKAALAGHDVVAMFDTGAYVSTVTTDLAKQTGTVPTPADNDQRAHGLGPQELEVASARFTSLTVGQEVIQNPTLHVADLFGADREVKTGSYIRQSIFQEPDLLIGADFFRAHRVYVARSQNKIYFTYSGGRIFEPERARESASAAPATSAPADAAADPAQSPAH
jgi:predicted aspartyl protease